MKLFRPFFHKELKPSREFTERTRRAFLAAFHSAFPPHMAHRAPSMRYVMRVAVAAFAVVLILGGGVFYADAANVGFASVWYPLKRSGEAISLALTSETEKSALHLKFAERRLEELNTLRAITPEDKRIMALASDFKQEVSRSLGDVMVEKELQSEETQKPPIETQKKPLAIAPKIPAVSAPVAVTASAPSLGSSGDQVGDGDAQEKMQRIRKEDDDDEKNEDKDGTTPPSTALRVDADSKENVRIEAVSTPSPKFSKSRDTERTDSQNEFCKKFEKVVRRISREMRKELFEEGEVKKRAEKKCGTLALQEEASPASPDTKGKN